MKFSSSSMTGRRNLLRSLTTHSLQRCVRWAFAFPTSYTAVVTAWNISFPSRDLPLACDSGTDVSGVRVSRNSAWSVASCLSMAFVEGETSGFTKHLAEVSLWQVLREEGSALLSASSVCLAPSKYTSLSKVFLSLRKPLRFSLLFQDLWIVHPAPSH